MTNIEGYKILADSLLQTENTRGAYFINKTKELGIEPADFFTDLKSLYDEMAKRVNSKDYHIWAVDEDGGNKEFLYHSINLYHLTNDLRHCIILDRDNIANIVLPGLQQFGELIMRDLKSQETEKHRQLIELLSLNQQTTTVKPPSKGFKSNLNDEQIGILYNAMVGNYFDATPANFQAIFKDEPLPPDFSIKWIDRGTTRHEPNKQTIFEFLYLLKDFNYLDKSIFDILTADKNNLYRKLETLFPDIKNFPQSNPQASQNRTPRQKELKTIISTL